MDKTTISIHLVPSMSQKLRFIGAVSKPKAVTGPVPNNTNSSIY